MERLRAFLGMHPPQGPEAEGQPMSLGERTRRGADGAYPTLHYDEEDLAREALETVDAFTMTSYPRMVTLWQQVRYLDRVGIPGSLVECGTWRGGACGMMALAHQTRGTPTRAIHLFDSFVGLPEPLAEKDGSAATQYAGGKATGALNSIRRCVASLEDNERLLGEIIGYPRELTVYHVGWFEETVPAAVHEVDPIALLRIDGDWYESTRVCLRHLYPVVSPGGIVVIDDYGRWMGCRRAVDEFLAELERTPFLNHIDGTGRYLIVP
jgi:O-methyltransferase